MYLSVKIIDNGDQIVISFVIFMFYMLEEYDFNMEDISLLELNKSKFVQLGVIVAPCLNYVSMVTIHTVDTEF